MAKRKGEAVGLSIGVDVSDKYSHACVLDENVEIIEETRLRSTPAGFKRYFGARERAMVTLEAGTHSPWMSRLLDELGHDVMVVNPRKLELIAKNVSKNDRNDAELLARLRSADARLLGPVKHRGEEAQADLELLRARDALVRARTLLVNHVRGAVKSMGAQLPKCSTAAFATKVARDIPDKLRPAIGLMLKQIKTLTEAIKAYGKEIEAVSQERYPETELFRQVHGVGPLTALCFRLTLWDPHRFKNSRSVGSYLGLRPRQDESGGSSPELRITKAGDGDLRRLLVQSAHHILGPFGKDSDLRRWGLKLADRGGKNAKKRAVVAVARKLAVLLHHLWVTAEVYEPLRNANQSKRAA